MSIRFDSETRIFVLETAHTSYHMKVDALGHLLHLYYGKTIGTGDLMQLYPRTDRGFSPDYYAYRTHRGVSPDLLPQEYTGCNVGDFRLSCLTVADSRGAFGADFTYVSHTVEAGKYQLTGLPCAHAEENDAETLIVRMQDETTGLTLELLYGVFAQQDIITRAARLTNHGDTPLRLDKAASACLDLPFGRWDLLHFHGRHAMERQLEREAVGTNIQTISSVRGSSSHHNNPFLILCQQDATETSGACYGVMMVYSGSYQMDVERSQTGLVRVVSGIQEERFAWNLKPGETFDTPEVILSFAAEGLTPLSQQYHRFLRRNICRGPWKDKRRPVLINNWEATYFDFNTEKIVKIAEKAASLGVEMMVLDDGWFGTRNDDNQGLGDWTVNCEKLPGGLDPLIGQINALGMKFGLWIEPEMVNENSQLYRTHPDWALTLPGRKPAMGRNQLVLDLSRPEVVDYLAEAIGKLLREHHIEYIKWDMNRSMADVYAGNLSYDYVLGVYDFMERLCSRYPDLLLEGCSGGGGRFDAGMLYYSPQIWCSDNTDAINRTRIQYGTSFFYPVSAMGAHVSAVPNHQTGRVTSFHTRGVTAMAGTFGYELNPALLSDEEKQQIREQIKTYKKYETLINEGTYWRLSDPFTDEIAAWMSVSGEQDHALVSVVRLMAEANQAAVYVRLRGLKPDAVYLEEQSGRQYSGAALMHAGIPLPPFTREYEAYQFAFTELKEAGRLYEKVQKWCDGNAENRVVISLYGGSGSGKTTLATALQQYFLNDGTGCYLLSGDDYPHRIPKRNDEERLRVYKEAGEDGLRGYLGTKKEIDFDRINEVLAAFHEGKDSITLRHMGREDGEISSEETDFSGISVLLLEWTHGGSDDLHGVDLPVFLESSPEETKERRIRRNRDENAASPFICRVVELEQEKLEVQRKNAGLIVGKDGRVYEP